MAESVVADTVVFLNLHVEPAEKYRVTVYRVTVQECRKKQCVFCVHARMMCLIVRDVCARCVCVCVCVCVCACAMRACGDLIVIRAMRACVQPGQYG